MIIDEKTSKILSNLRSKNPEIVLDAIEKIRESGNGSILTDIIELLHDNDNIEIQKSVLNLLSELKDKESIPVLITAIKNDKYTNERKDLVACCWQNGLSYNEYLPLFIDMVINEEFQCAFEAFTVIENMYGKIEDEVIEKEILKIENGLNNSDLQKGYLLNGLLAIIRDIPEKQEFSD